MQGMFSEERPAFRTSQGAGLGTRSDCRGFTLVETLAVISIVCVLAAILFPVFASAKESGHRTACGQNLKQISMALALYRSEHDGDGKWGAPREMGLPPIGMATPGIDQLLKIDRLRCARFPSGFGIHGRSASYLGMFYADYPGVRNSWSPYVKEIHDGAVILTDIHHNSPATPWGSTWVSHHGLGITLDSTLLKHFKPGDSDQHRWWTSPCTTDCH